MKNMANFQCRDAEEFFVDAVSGRLSADDRDTLQQHLDACAACRESFEEMDSAAAILNEVSAQSDVQSQLWKRIQTSTTRAAAKPLSVLREPAFNVWWAAAAMVALALLIGLAVPFGRATNTAILPPAPKSIVETPPLHASETPETVKTPPAIADVDDSEFPAPQNQPNVAAAENEIRRDTLAPPPAPDIPAPIVVAPPPPVPPSSTEAPAREPLIAQTKPANEFVRPARTFVSDVRGLMVTSKSGPAAVREPGQPAWRGLTAGDAIAYGATIRTGLTPPSSLPLAKAACAWMRRRPQRSFSLKTNRAWRNSTPAACWSICCIRRLPSASNLPAAPSS